jgi:hypothetical protein
MDRQPHTQYYFYYQDKSKVHPRTGHEDTEREYRYSFLLSLTLMIDGVDG